LFTRAKNNDVNGRKIEFITKILNSSKAAASSKQQEQLADVSYQERVLIGSLYLED
jgi:hypothetical protein